jgi:tetratricopeptide (TPR) repeat protein
MTCPSVGGQKAATDAGAPPRWNVQLAPSPGHTGRILVTPDWQLHEGPGKCGAGVRQHLHKLDPVTGRLDESGVPLTEANLDKMLQPEAPKRWPGQEESGDPDRTRLRELFQKVRESLAGDDPFSQDARNVWNDFARAVEKELDRLEKECREKPDSGACERLRRALAAYLDILRKRLDILVKLFKAKCQPPEKGKKAWCEDLAREIEEMTQKIREIERRLRKAPLDKKAVAELAKLWARPIDAGVERDLIAERWGAVAKALAGKEEAALSPIARMVLGHAHLATNRNNESLVLFWSSMSYRAHCQAWHAWTGELLRRHPDSAMASYLQGDALARLGRHEQAARAFDAALARDPKLHLARHARGVLRCAQGDLEAALVDLVTATKGAPQLSEAHASLGALWVRWRAPEGAKRAYDDALKLVPDFALALNGRGCACYGMGRWNSARTDLQDASRLSAQSPSEALATVNLIALEEAEAQARIALAAAGAPVGAFVTRFDNRTREAYLELTTQINANPTRVGEACQQAIAKHGIQGIIAMQTYKQEGRERLTGLANQLTTDSSTLAVATGQFGRAEQLRDNFGAWETGARVVRTAAVGGQVFAKNPSLAEATAIVGAGALLVETADGIQARYYGRRAEALARELQPIQASMAKSQSTFDTELGKVRTVDRFLGSGVPEMRLGREATGILQVPKTTGAEGLQVNSAFTCLTSTLRGVGETDAKVHVVCDKQMEQKLLSSCSRFDVNCSKVQFHRDLNTAPFSSNDKVINIPGEQRSQIGGITTDERGAFVDKGHWAVSAIFGLVYPEAKPAARTVDPRGS